MLIIYMQLTLYVACYTYSLSRIVIFQLVFHLQWMQFSQHSEAIQFYHDHSNPINRAVEIPLYIYIYTAYTYIYRYIYMYA